MMTRLVQAAEGALGGLAATLLMNRRRLRRQQYLPGKLKPTVLRQNPGDYFITKAEYAFKSHLPRPAKLLAVQGAPLAYGALWPALYGFMSPEFSGARSWRKLLATGAALGVVVWSISYIAILPAAGLTAPVHRQGASHIATDLLNHIDYGMAAAFSIFIVKSLRRQRTRMGQESHAALADEFLSKQEEISTETS